jgi:hypothetical protein
MHAPGEDATQLAVLITRDGLWERVDGHTPVDEVIAGEIDLGIVEPLEDGIVLVPAEDYKVMREWMEAHGALTDRALPRLDWQDHKHAGAGELVLSPEELQGVINRARVHTFRALMRYVWQGSGNLWAAMRNLLAITHKNAPEFIKGMSGAQIGRFLGIGRAAFNKQSIRLVVDYLESWGVKGGTAGGSKPHDHRETKRRQMKGRRHRAKDYEPETPKQPELTTEQKEAQKWRVKMLREMAEKRRLAEMIGCNPEDIDLDKINPAEAA